MRLMDWLAARGPEGVEGAQVRVRDDEGREFSITFGQAVQTRDSELAHFTIPFAEDTPTAT